MLKIAKHSTFVGYLAMSLFVAGSSGIAFVLQTCSMPVKMACCQTMNDDNTGDCTGQTQPKGTVVLQAGASCGATILVGGLTTNPGVVENNHPVQKAPVVVAPVNDVVACAPVLNIALFAPQFAESVSPPSVDKHILNATLLI